MRKWVLVSAVILSAIPLFAAAKGNWYGWVKAEGVNQEGCPVSLERVGVQDSENQNKTAMALLGPVQSNGVAPGHNPSVRYDVGIKTVKSGIVALEVEWTSRNAMDEPQGSRKMSFAWKKPIPAYSTKYESESNDRLAGDVVTYSVRVTRVKFVDGTIWQAPVEEAQQAGKQP